MESLLLLIFRCFMNAPQFCPQTKKFWVVKTYPVYKRIGISCSSPRNAHGRMFRNLCSFTFFHVFHYDMCKTKFIHRLFITVSVLSRQTARLRRLGKTRSSLGIFAITSLCQQPYTRSNKFENL